MAKPLSKLKNCGRNALVITAHPDDESIFMGGTIAEFKRWKWRVLCMADCDERYNKRRRGELLRVSKIYKKNGVEIEPFMLGIVKRKGRFSKEEIKRKIGDFLRLYGTPEIVFTHNKWGEYGHKTHKLIHDIVKRFGFSNIYTFYFGAAGWMNRGKLDIVKLSNPAFLTKKRAIRVYLKGSQKTNLSRLKKLTNWALKSKLERFYRDY